MKKLFMIGMVLVLLLTTVVSAFSSEEPEAVSLECGDTVLFHARWDNPPPKLGNVSDLIGEVWLETEYVKMKAVELKYRPFDIFTSNTWTAVLEMPQDRGVSWRARGHIAGVPFGNTLYLICDKSFLPQVFQRGRERYHEEK